MRSLHMLCKLRMERKLVLVYGVTTSSSFLVEWQNCMVGHLTYVVSVGI